MVRWSRRALASLLAAAAMAASRSGRAQSVGYAGDNVTCTNEHPIARLTRMLLPGETPQLSLFADWHMDVPRTLEPPPPCPRCGQPWLHTSTDPGGPQVHVADRGWVPS